MRFGVFLVLSVSGVAAFGEEYDGVEFPYGMRSFADAVPTYSPVGEIPTGYDNTDLALKPPDYPDENTPPTFVCLGPGGTIILKFNDNALIDQDAVEGGRDLWIFECGGNVESFQVWISEHGENWIDLGTVSGQPTGIDIKGHITPGQSFRFVKIQDVEHAGGAWPGADIDAVGAIGSVPIFKRGDTNVDVTVNVGDAVCILDYLFGPAGSVCKTTVPTCTDAADANDDGAINIADALKILNYLFRRDSPLPPPFGECGPDTAGADALDCTAYPPCE